jgi:hypothetical protein
MELSFQRTREQALAAAGVINGSHTNIADNRALPTSMDFERFAIMRYVRNAGPNTNTR